jgi:aldehyde:ferredoxin oxidoreductase
MGLVMASKNLKAIAVRGNQTVKIANQPKLVEISKKGAKEYPTNPDVEPLGTHGTAIVVGPQNAMGTLPTRNYTEAQFEKATDISGETMTETILKKRDTCYACIVRCKRVVEISEGEYKVDPYYGGPEYETLGTFGSYCGIGNLAAIAFANQVCNTQGVDTITCGATIAFAMECFEKGIIGLKDTGGIELKYGNEKAMLKTLDEIVHCSTPFGKLLARGSARVAEAWGPEAKKCLITCKNEEMPAHMPQQKKSLALIYAVNPFGADHQSSEHDWMYEEGCSQLYLDRLALIGVTNPPPAPGSFGPDKVKFATLTQVFYSLLDTLELCQFVWGPGWTLYGPQETVDMVNAITGWDVTVDELMKVGERRLNLLKAFNVREGMSRKDDKLPEKVFTPLTGTGPTAGVAVSKDDLEKAIDQYYDLLGWTNDGIPTMKCLEKLDIAWVAESSNILA